jgi:hypothetical protein
MRKIAALGFIAVFVLAAGLVVLRASGCSAWQNDYKRFLYSEMLKNSPIIHTPEDIDRIIGMKPSGCERPTSLTQEDVARYRKEKVGPNEFLEEVREAARQTAS